MISLFFGKLGFVHRQLWNGSRLYQASVLAGPAALLGLLLATGLWAAGLRADGSNLPAVPAWATPEPSDLWKNADGAPLVVKPSQPLPLIDAEGALAGYKPGWRMAAHAIEVKPGFDVNVESAPLTASPLEGAKIEMTRVLQEAPKVPLYAGTGQAFLVAKTAGVYTVSARFDRPPAEPADCLMRLAFGPHRVFSDIQIAIINEVSKTLGAVRFELEPGLYSIGWAFTCWHDQAVTAPGSLTLLIGHPGESAPLPARPDDIVHREAAAPAH